MKILVVYYSYSGITRRLAEDIALITDGDLLELKPLRPYSFSYNTAVKEARIEIDKGYCPPLAEEIGNIDDVDVVLTTDDDSHSEIAYPVAVLKDSKQAKVAQQFEDFLLSDKAQNILEKHGFNKVK